MDTGCKHGLTTRDAIPLCQVGMITKARNPVLFSSALQATSSAVTWWYPNRSAHSDVTQNHTFSTNHPTSYLLVDGVAKTDRASSGCPYSLAPTLRCPTGKVVKLVPRDRFL